MPYKYHTFLLQAKIDNNAAVPFLDFSLSPAININMVNVVHTHNHSENSGLILINFMCLNGCNSSKTLKIKKLFITSISSGFYLQVFSITLCMHKSLFSMVVVAYKYKGMLKI